MADRLTWRMVRFTALQGGPAYTDLGEIAAILDTQEPQLEGAPAPQLAVARGASIYLKSGARYYVKETAETVFEELHRFRTEQEPAPPASRVPGAAPAATLAGDTVAPGTEADHG
jgi:hypothetical protein